MNALICLNSKLSPDFLKKLENAQDEIDSSSYSDLSVQLKKEALNYGAKSANVCYSKKDFSEIFSESPQATAKRLKRTLGMGHHSVYEHIYLTFELKDLPKSLVMILNNQAVYVTSEKSSRYTTPNSLEGIEKELYNKWYELIVKEIRKHYSNILDDSRIEKLGQENARYMASVHTPTNLIHTLSFRQLNYLMHLFEDFIALAPKNSFNNSLKNSMKEFLGLPEIKNLYVPELKGDVKDAELNWHKHFNYGEHFDSTYCTTYSLSFAALAQAQRHRTLNYQVNEFEELHDYFVPKILPENLKKEWLNDLESVSRLFPQASLLSVTERGTFEHFKMKAIERLCGSAQLEIMQSTKATLDKYLASPNKDIAGYLKNKAVSKCMKGKCPMPCEFGPKMSLARLV